MVSYQTIGVFYIMIEVIYTTTWIFFTMTGIYYTAAGVFSTTGVFKELSTGFNDLVYYVTYQNVEPVEEKTGGEGGSRFRRWVPSLITRTLKQLILSYN